MRGQDHFLPPLSYHEATAPMPLSFLPSFHTRSLVFASLTSSDLRPSRGVPTCVIIISTWEIENLHVDIFYSPRRDETIPPKFHLIPPKFHFIPT